MSDRIRVFVDERGIEVSPESVVRDAVAALDPGASDALSAGRAYVTDGVGRPLAVDAPLAAGAILRVIRSAPPPTA